MAPTLAEEITESSVSAESHPPESPTPSPSFQAALVPADAAIATLAYALWEARGRLDGCAEEDWLAAEASLRQAASRQPR